MGGVEAGLVPPKHLLSPTFSTRASAAPAEPCARPPKILQNVSKCQHTAPRPGRSHAWCARLPAGFHQFSTGPRTRRPRGPLRRCRRRVAGKADIAATLGFRWLSLAFLGFFAHATLAFLGFCAHPTLAFVGFSKRAPWLFLAFPFRRRRVHSAYMRRATRDGLRVARLKLMHNSKQHRPPRRRCKAEKRAVRWPITGHRPWIEHFNNNVKGGDSGGARGAPIRS